MALYRFNKTTLKYEPLNSVELWMGGLLIALLVGAVVVVCCAFSWQKGNVQGRSCASGEELRLIIEKHDEFTTDKLHQYLKDLNIKFPEIVYAQACLETGKFTSEVFKNNRNLFGMKEAKVRPTTNCGTDLGHAVYFTWRESVMDYALYQAAFLSDIRTEEEYYNYLSQFYAEDPSYVVKVKAIVAQNQS
jgi:hypothetical protein